jgi:hypothetical protein
MRTELSPREQARQATGRTGAPAPGTAVPGPRPRGGATDAPARPGRDPRLGRDPRARHEPRAWRDLKDRDLKDRDARPGPADPPGPVRTRPTRPARPAPPRPAAAPRPEAPPAAAPSRRPKTVAGVPRTPFVLFVLGLLGGGLVCLLIINTTLETAQFRINNLQQQNTSLSQQEQQLQQEIATDRAPATIEQRAYHLGMRPDQRNEFLDLRTGRIYRQPSKVPGLTYVPPGYTP